MGLPGFSVREIDPVEENGEWWAGPQVQFPAGIASHSPLEEFYFDNNYLLRRHDYRVDVAGGFPTIHFVYEIVEANGVKLPTKRRAYRCDADGHPMPDELMVSIDLTDIRFTQGREALAAVSRAGVEVCGSSGALAVITAFLPALHCRRGRDPSGVAPRN
jgi:hypothetical protein